jgi:hypothetical protein
MQGIRQVAMEGIQGSRRQHEVLFVDDIACITDKDAQIR